MMMMMMMTTLMMMMMMMMTMMMMMMMMTMMMMIKTLPHFPLVELGIRTRMPFLVLSNVTRPYRVSDKGLDNWNRALGVYYTVVLYGSLNPKP